MSASSGQHLTIVNHEHWAADLYGQRDGPLELVKLPNGGIGFIKAASAAPWRARPAARPELPQRILNGDSVTLMPAIAPLAPYEWTVFVRTETKKVAHAKLIRRRLMPNVRQSDPPAPLQGMVFEPEAPNGASVLVVGGSEGGVFPARAALLAAAGFRTYALAY